MTTDGTEMTEEVMKENKQSLVLPSSKREKLLMRIGEFKTGNLTAKDQQSCGWLSEKLNILFSELCWSKLGISSEQLKQLDRQDLEELAEMIYEHSKIAALIQTGIWACVPIVGWLVLLGTFEGEISVDEPLNASIRYYWWYRKIKNKFGKNFKLLIDR